MRCIAVKDEILYEGRTCTKWEDLVDGELNLALACAPRVFRKVAHSYKANHFRDSATF